MRSTFLSPFQRLAPRLLRQGLQSLCRLFVFLVASHQVLACSAVLKWDVDKLPCDQTVKNGNTLFCLSGYSCERESLLCVRDASLKEGEGCSLAKQCGDGLVCPLDLLDGGGKVGVAGVKECLNGCIDNGNDGGFLQTTGCKDQGEVCLPYLNANSATAGKALVGGCFPSAGCTPGTACAPNGADSGGICVVMGNSNATACLSQCEITWDTTLKYSDNCTDGLHGCQVVGVAGQQAFACLYNGQNSNTNPLAAVSGQTPAAAGAACSPVLKPCADDGYVCTQGVCSQYCRPQTTSASSNCPAAQICCPFKDFGSSQETGFCSTATACP